MSLSPITYKIHSYAKGEEGFGLPRKAKEIQGKQQRSKEDAERGGDRSVEADATTARYKIPATLSVCGVHPQPSGDRDYIAREI